MSKASIPGLSIAIVTDNQIRWSKAFGFADLENFVPFLPTTVHRLASVSKTLTAVAAMQLAERGKLDLEAPIQKYCPAFPKKQRPITSLQLLGHLSGIRHYATGENFDSTRHFESIEESLAPFKDDPLLQEPGSKYTYTTYGYVVLGCVIEGASGMTFADALRENVTKPAGMERTRPDDALAIVPNRARGYARLQDGRLRNASSADTSNKVPGGGLLSTAEDLARFAIALETGKLLKPETFRRMRSPMKTTDGKESAYFGWRIGERLGEQVLSHTGSQQGTATFFGMVPEKGFALALIANTEDAGLRDLAREITDILLP